MYNIIFIDKTIFTGGKNLQNSQWNEVPNKPIKKIKYNLLGHTLILENYESYNHLIVHEQELFTKNNYISKVILLAKSKEKVQKFIFDLRKNDVITEIVTYGKEFNNSFTTGWKKGIDNSIPKYKID